MNDISFGSKKVRQEEGCNVALRQHCCALQVRCSFHRETTEEPANLVSKSLLVEMRNTPLPPPSNEVVEYVRTATGVNEHRIKEAIKLLKNWLKLQPHLPHDYGKLYQTLIPTLFCFWK
jgi:hypothetical protein